MQVTICLTDINDNIPQFVDVPDTCVRYAENVTGQDVVSLQVHDPDLDMNGEVQFMLTCVDKFGADCDGEWFVCACGQLVLLLRLHEVVLLTNRSSSLISSKLLTMKGSVATDKERVICTCLVDIDNMWNHSIVRFNMLSTYVCMYVCR